MPTKEQMKEMSDLGAVGRAAAINKTVKELVSDTKFFSDTSQGAAIKDRALEMPKNCVRTYLRAMRGRAPKTAIRAMCQMCMGWGTYLAKSIALCTDPACPLYPYRPKK